MAISLLIFSSTIARARQVIPGTPSESFAGFEGRGVASVDISASPAVHLDTIRPLIKQKVGQPFSTAAIRESVSALQATKRFTSVQVSIGFGSKGLDVLFVLQPTSYVGMLYFPGASSLPYVELMQATNISEQTPYYSELLPQGKGELLAFLRKEGYFAATVQADIQRDDAHRIVNIIFHTDLKGRAKIGKVEIHGVTQQQASQELQGLASFWSKLRGRSLKPGESYTPNRIQKATSYIVSSLESSHRLAASVRNVSPDYDAENNRANVKFQVRPGPLVYLQVRGAHISGSTLRQQVPVEQENAVNRDIAIQGERSLANYFQGKGYANVAITSQYQQQDDKVTITYEVKLGTRYNVKESKFAGNHLYGEDRLESAIPIKPTHSILGFRIIGGKFDKSLVSQSVASIETLYRHAGFEHVSVEPKVNESGKTVQVTFNIAEGPQDRVATFRIEGNSSEPASALSGSKPLNLEPGQPYSPYRLDQDRNRILAAYLDLGYLDATFNSTVAPSPKNPHLMNVVYFIHEGMQGHISAVVPLGQNMTRPAFIQSVIHARVKAGMPLSEGNFLTAESDLYNLGIFDWVSVKPLEPTVNKPQDEVLVKVHESKRYSMDIGGGIEIMPRSANIPVGAVALPGLPVIGLGSKFTVTQKSFIGPRFSFALSRNDILGRAETATISTILSRLDQRGEFSYADPRLWSASWSALASASAERSTLNPIYTAILGVGSIQAEKSLHGKKTENLIFRYSLDKTDLSNIVIPDLVLPEDQHVRLSSVSAEFLRDTRDNPLDAHHGMFQTYSIGVTPTPFGSTQNFIRILAQNSVYVPMKPWLTWASRLSTGFAVPFADSHVPLSERFFSGGPDSLRGFPVDGAGPQRPVQACSDPANPSTCTLISVPVGGDMLFIVNTEARFPLPVLHNLGGVIFYDGGNVYNNINLRQMANDYTNTIGGGLRYKTPVGPVRFDVGYRLTPIPGVAALQYFVTVGQSF
ncbi:MAG TPA: POTRA domain-containing protein [Candidatus Dormibacteraeota bacterium]|nr:POTRA domain-containing protein [Candidatus Dormibacteraeota bacterium]